MLLLLAVVGAVFLLLLLLAIWSRLRREPKIEPAVISIGQPAPVGAEEKPPSSKQKRKQILPSVFVVVDLETTGLDCDSHEIIEIGAVRVVLDAQEHETYQVLVKPQRKVSKSITALTGITQAMVDAEGVSLREAMEGFRAFVQDAPLVTYNASFDMRFLWTAACRSEMVLSNKYTCALQRARKAFPDLDSHKLAHVSANIGAPQSNQHRALGDCERALHVFWRSCCELGTTVRWSKCPPEHLEKMSSFSSSAL